MRSSLACFLGLLLSGCVAEMDVQPRHPAWRKPPAGTVPARQRGGDPPHAPPMSRGPIREHQPDEAQPALNLALLERGREQFTIYCQPCHGAGGHGDGPVVRRGFPAPPSLHESRLRQAPDRHFYGVISNGAGRMFSYADRLEPAERWAVVAYIRALQLSEERR